MLFERVLIGYGPVGKHICEFGLVHFPRHGEIEGPPVPDSVFQKTDVASSPKNRVFASDT